jgi:hypothetical protein
LFHQRADPGFAERIFLALSESLYQSCGLTGKPDKHHRYRASASAAGDPA